MNYRGTAWKQISVFLTHSLRNHVFSFLPCLLTTCHGLIYFIIYHYHKFITYHRSQGTFSSICLVSGLTDGSLKPFLQAHSLTAAHYRLICLFLFIKLFSNNDPESTMLLHNFSIFEPNMSQTSSQLGKTRKGLRFSLALSITL